MRWRIAVTAAAVTVALFATSHVRTDWDLFWFGGELLREHGLGLYAHRPDLLIGPLPLLYAWAAPSWLEAFTPAVVAGVVVWVVSRRSVALAVVLSPALLAAPLWGHIDDVAATLCALAVIRLRDRPRRAGLLLGVGIACKPWVLPLIALHRSWRYKLVATVVTVAVWGPFLVNGGWAVGTYHVEPQPGSLWGVLGVMPPGIRLWQLAAMTAVILALRDRPAAAVGCAFAVRVLLEPGDWSYYSTPLAMLAGWPQVVPVLLTWAVPVFGWPGWIRVLALVALVLHEPIARRAVRVLDAAVRRPEARVQ